MTEAADRSASSLPNLLVVGAMKAGTTSLHSYLQQHPDIEMSEPKELHFFNHQGTWSRGLDWYRAHFDPSATVRGESSTHYSAYPHFQGVTEKARRTLPDARIVLVARDPVDRIVSHYVHEWAAGREPRSFDEVVADLQAELERGEEYVELTAGPGYLARSLYHLQVSLWADAFGAEQVLVVDHDDLADDPAGTVGAVVQWLGLDPVDLPSAYDVQNSSGGKRQLSAPGRVLRRLGGSALAARLPASVREPLVRTTIRVVDQPAPRPTPTTEQLEVIHDLVGADVEALRASTGTAFARWSL